MNNTEKQPEEKKKKSDYQPSSGEYFLEQMTQDPAAIRDMLEKIKTGDYEALFILNEKGEIIEEKVTDKTGKFIWYNNVRETGQAVIAPQVKKTQV